MSITSGDINSQQKHFFGAWPRELQSMSEGYKNKQYSSDAECDDDALNAADEIKSRHTNQYHCNHAMRSRFQRISSLELIPEYPQQELENHSHGAGTLIHNIHITSSSSSSFNVITKIVRRGIFFVPCLLLQLTLSLMRYVLYIPFSIAAPSFWLSALLWIFWKLLRFPINFLRWLAASSFGSLDSVDGQEKIYSRSIASTPKPRTVLISCGSTIQTLHLARNFYSCGTRVIVFEFEGLFGLARFSQAVDKFYVVPRPTASNPDSYINALCKIVRKEQPSVYIPVCATSPAFFDALAKPHLELLGCASFIPGVQETLVLDDCLEFFQKCNAHDIPLPSHSVLNSLEHLQRLYTSGFIGGNFRSILVAVGMQGLLERYKYILPTNGGQLKFNHSVSEQNPWLLVRDVPGDHYITCTTVKDSRVVANVTCKIESGTQNLMPIVSSIADQRPSKEEEEIDIWLRTFFAKVRFQRNINGHLSFRLVRCQSKKILLPLGIRIGVSLPYICYNRSHARILWRTIKCVHMMQLSVSQDEESLLAALSASWNGWAFSERCSVVTTPLDKREALFAYWDPLPYCAFYHFQLPLESVKVFLQNRHRSATNKVSSTTSPCVTKQLNKLN